MSLEAELTVEPERGRAEELVARGALVNAGAEAVELDPAPLESPSLALELVDAAGEPVLLPPPPVPGGERRRTRLDPGGRVPVELHGFLPSWSPGGTYRVRLRYLGLVAAAGEAEQVVEVRSDWTTVEATG